MKQILSLILIVFSIWLTILADKAYPETGWPAIPCVVGIFTTIYFVWNAIEKED